MTLNKRILTVFPLIVLLFGLCVSCKNKSKNVEEETTEIKMSLSEADTTKVIDLMHQYFDFLLNKNYEGAKAMVSQYRNDTLVEMSPEMSRRYEMGMKIISPIRYEIETMIFRTNRDCLVRYSGVLFDKEGPKDNRPNKMYFAIKPVRILGEWHLTVADDNDRNTIDSQIAK